VNLMPLATRLHTLKIGIKEKTLFLHMMPAGAQAILLRSPLAGTAINHELPGFFRGEFQIIVRSPDALEGEKLIKRVVEALTMADGEEVGTQTFKYCRPRHQPVAFPLSDGSLIETTVQMDCCFVES
jgi:hypothetical protein